MDPDPRRRTRRDDQPGRAPQSAQTSVPLPRTFTVPGSGTLSGIHKAGDIIKILETGGRVDAYTLPAFTPDCAGVIHPGNSNLPGPVQNLTHLTVESYNI